MTDSLKLRRIRRAIRGWHVLRVTRKQGTTTIKPHILFETQEGEVVVSGLYVGGYTSRPRENLWRQYPLRSLEQVEVLPATFSSAVADYNPESPHYHQVLCALPRKP